MCSIVVLHISRIFLDTGSRLSGMPYIWVPTRTYRLDMTYADMDFGNFAIPRLLCYNQRNQFIYYSYTCTPVNDMKTGTVAKPLFPSLAPYPVLTPMRYAHCSELKMASEHCLKPRVHLAGINGKRRVCFGCGIRR